ncbi:hypothetical protein [Acidisoma sp. 7E03]
MTRPTILQLCVFAMCLAGAPVAAAAMDTTCGQAIERIHYHPTIEANSVLAVVVGTWRSMDQQTMASGHPPITDRMLASSQAVNGLVRQCEDNPGQSLEAAASAIYRLARQDLDGY